jgi:hypothetical protein
MVGKKSGWVIVSLNGRFAEEGKGPGDLDVVGCLPFAPNFVVNFPGALHQGALHEAMLKGFFRVGVAHFA